MSLDRPVTPDPYPSLPAAGGGNASPQPARSGFWHRFVPAYQL